MKGKQLPLKLRILEWALDYNKPFDAEDVYNGISDEYKGERFCNPKHVSRLIGAYCGNAIMDIAEYESEQSEEVQVKYRVTDFGKKAAKLIPGRNELP